MTHSHLPFLKTIRTLILLTVLLIFKTFNAQSQTVLFTEGFEGAFPATGWTIQNYSNTNAWQQYSFSFHTGGHSAAVFPNAANANSWLFTAGQPLQAGRTYVFSYYAEVQDQTLMKVTLNTSPDYFGQYKTLRNSFIVNNDFNLYSDTIVCEVTGTYYIGFNNYSVVSFTDGSYIDDITFTRLEYPNCNAVSAGTINSSVSTICPGATFSLVSNNPTTATNWIRYAWQKSTDGTNWTNITDGYTYQPVIQVSQLVNTYYRLTDTCTVSGNTSVSNQVLVNNSSFQNCYCTPVRTNCASPSFGFANITFLNTGLTNNSGCSTNGYGNFTSLGSATVYRGQNIYIQHTINNQSNSAYSVGMWVDLDHSGTFDAQEFVADNLSTGATSVSQYLIPATALTGETTIRIKLATFSPFFQMSSDACGGTSNLSGEVEDYKIVIADAASCTGTISAGTISSSVSQICPNNNFTITAANPTTYQGQVRYAWQRSTDNVNWTNINNTSYLVNPLVISQNSNTYYRLTDTCLASSQTSVSNAITVSTNSVFTCYCTPNTGNCSVFGIDSVSFNTIHNASSCSPNGYGNYIPAISTTINNGTNVPLYLKFKATGSTKYYYVWIDFNRNGKYESGEVALSGTTTANFISAMANIPFNINAGETGMRVMVTSLGLGDACSIGLSTGEVEDYRVVLNVVNPITNKFSYYVNQTATGLNDGSTWANAFISLTAALSYAKTSDTIKVAKGIYTPGTANTSSYSLKDSLYILGGYPNTGNPTNADRNFANNQSILSGEIGTGVNTDNIRIILQASNVKGFVLDGFIIEKGYDGYVSTTGPIYFINSSGTIKNTVIRNNFNLEKGCAITVTNSNITLLNDIIHDNITNGFLPASAVLSISQKSNVTLTNSIIAKNQSLNLVDMSNSSLKVLNSTIFKNYGFTNIHDTSSLLVQNSILSYNGYNYNVDTSDFKKDIYSSITASQSITDNYTPGVEDYMGLSPRFIDTARIAGADNKYFTGDDGLRLTNPCSPGINTGNNTYAQSLSKDIAGDDRIKNGVVDLGAYEVQESLVQQPKILYVNKAATGQNNGLTWQDAFTDLQAGFAHCSDTLKVAKGTYPVSSTDAAAYFQLSNNRVIMGGFPNTGNPGNGAFDPVANPTIIDGTVNANTKIASVIVSKNNNNSSRVIGFEIINAAAPTQFYPQNFAAIKVGFRSSPYFEKIKLDCSKNQESSLLSIYVNSNPKFYKSTFFNTINDPNGAGSISISGNSNPAFVKCYFGKDTTSTLAGVPGVNFLIDNSATFIDSCIFNKAASHAIYAGNNSHPVIQNSVFNKTNGRSVTSNASSPLVMNCVFNDTVVYTDDNGGTIGNYNNSNPVFRKCQFVNSYNSHNGGVCYNENSSAEFSKCAFINSHADFIGAVFFNQGSHLKVVNCVAYGFYINENTSYPSSSFLCNYDNSTSEIISSTVVTPSANLKSLITSSANSSVKLYNSILWKYGALFQNTNAMDDISTADNNNTAMCDIRNSMLYKQRNTAMTSTTVGINPKLVNLSYAPGTDAFLYTTDDGFKPCTCSHALNNGNNSLNSEAKDIAEENRIKNGTIDIGAYEVNEYVTTDNKFYVKQNALPGGDGRSWSGAYNNLQKAILNSCADTIFVAKGIYKPAVSSKDSSFEIFNNVVLLGGYPDSGNPVDADRDLNLNPTILSGNIGVANDTTDNSRSVLRIHCPDSTVILDRFIIEKGNADLQSSGGGIQSVGNKNLVISNCIIRNNYGFKGGGLFSTYSNLLVSKSVLTNNTSDYYGGGFYIDDNYMVLDGRPWKPIIRFKNSVISNNTGTGGMFFGSGVMVPIIDTTSFENTIFYKNSGNSGGGLVLDDNPYVKITNCAFVRNNNLTGMAGIGILVRNPYNYGTLNTSVHNTIFYDNWVFGHTGSYLNNDFNWDNGSANQETIPNYGLNYSAINYSGSQTGSGAGNISAGGIVFPDIENGAGPDNTWMTPDDGLRPTGCTNSADRGSNQYVQNIPKDIIDSVRIQNGIVDVGPYEASGFSVKITASDTAICPGTTVTFTATALNAGTTASYQWTVNGVNVGTNANTFSSATLNNNDLVQVKVKKQECAANIIASSNIIHMTVSNAIVPVATITASDTTICAGAGITFTASATHSNSNSVYQWSVNNVNTGTNSPNFTASNFSNGDVVKVSVTINGTCLSTQSVTSNNITVHVNPIVSSSVTIVSSANSICDGSSVTYTATPVNAGISPSYQWKVNGVNVGTNATTFTSAGINQNDIITVVMTSTAVCAASPIVTSNAITQQVAVHAAPIVTVIYSSITCPGIPVTFTANATNGGSNPLYQWTVNGINTGTQSNVYTSSSLNEGDQVRVILTSSANCIQSSAVSSVIVPVHYTSAVAPAVSISSSAPVCTNTAVTFTAIPINGGTAPTYQWYVNNINTGVTGTTFTTNTLTNNDQVKVVMTTSAGCALAPTATSNIITTNISGTVTPSVSITANQANICAGILASFTATATNGGTDPVFQWKRNGSTVASAGATYSSSAIANGDIITCQMTSSLPCVSVATVTSSNYVAVVNPAPAIPVITLNGSQLSTTAGLSGYQWYLNGTAIASATSNTYTPSASGTYTVEVKNTAGCKSTSAGFDFVVTAVSNVVVSGVNITCFPNPANTTLYLKLSARPVDKPLLRMIDNTGRVILEKVLNSQLVTLDVSGFASGIYLLNISGSKGAGSLVVEVIH